MSSLGWIDFDEADRDRAQQIMALFQERESRDELGLGAIRDSIADHLFPGTSTIQTRLRYMLFVPWIFGILDARDLPESQIRAEARALEVRLADALKAGGETNGIIGRDAGPRLKRLPSSVYWAGLGAWGIRLFPGSADSYFVSMRSSRRSRAPREREDIESNPSTAARWSQSLPGAPKDLFERAVFLLTVDEAQFVIDQLIAQQPAALLTTLAREGDDADCDHIWVHPNLAAFPAEARRIVRHGETFSQVMHGAALLYNLALSELRGRDDWVARYREMLDAWADEVDLSTVRAWPMNDFWDAVKHPAHTVRPAAKLFVTRWIDLIIDGKTKVDACQAARLLVRNRERGLKTGQSRYTNHAVLDRWNGASGVGRINFRWSQARSHLWDLAHAE